jgi:glycosyltransferase involved in cell wall biosynthesis
MNPKANIYRTDIILRKQFYKAAKWKWHTNTQIIFTSSSGSNIYKGLHVVFRAFSILATVYPKLVLHVAGAIKYDSILQDGYTTWLLRLAKQLNIEDRIVWLGPLDEMEMIDQLQQASVCVIPSFIETYCVALAEAMMIGTPCVVSFAGAMPELAVHRSSALFFPIDDASVCNTHIDTILSDETFASQMSLEAIKTVAIRNNPEKILNLQLDIYEQVIAGKG